MTDHVPGDPAGVPNEALPEGYEETGLNLFDDRASVAGTFPQAVMGYDRKSVDKYAHVASHKELATNEYNLNIPRYVDTFEEEEEIDVVDCEQD